VPSFGEQPSGGGADVPGAQNADTHV